MPRIKSSSLLRLIEKSCQSITSQATDSQLLERFLRCRDETAFEVLLWRHGSLVLKICQDILQDSFAAEDAFQAAFLVLARKAGSINKRQSLASWLYKVAYRVALKARTETAKRSDLEKSGHNRLPDQIACESTFQDEESLRELRALLYQEIARLPRKYQAPLILCLMEEKSHEQAAEQLGWAKGTVSGRLARGREMLQRHLRSRGLGPACGLLLAGLLPNGALAVVPPALAQATCKAALLFAAGKAAGVSTKVLVLAEGVIQAMLYSKVKFAASLILVLAGMIGIGVLSQKVPAEENRGVPAQPVNHFEAKLVVEKRPIKVVSPRDGIIMVVGTEKPGEKLSPEQAVVIRSGKETRTFKKLKVGDRVEVEQVIGRLDDRLALNDVERAKSKLAAAKFELEASIKVSAEAQTRYDIARKLPVKLISAEELREKKLGAEKFQSEVGIKKEGVNLAALDLRRAEIMLEMHVIHSPVRGVIRVIHKNRGEGVKALEPILEIVPDQE